MPFKNISNLENPWLCTMYLSSMTLADAKQFESYHHEVHGIKGMIRSLDCSHVVWGDFATAHHGQYKGKKGKPPLLLKHWLTNPCM